MHRSPGYLLLAILILLFLPGAPLPINPQSIQAQVDGGYLILNEISPWPSDGNVWVELVNPSSIEIPLDGYTVEFLSGFSYTFPENSRILESGDVHLLRLTGGNPLNTTGDGCMLSNPDGPVDAVTWGYPPSGIAATIPSGSPLMPPTEIYREDIDLFQPDDVLIRIPGTWPPTIQNYVGTSNWAYRSSDSASPNEPNPMPGPTRFFPGDGAVIASDFGLYAAGLSWATEFTFQIALDEEFTEIVLEETVDVPELILQDFEPGDYFWRVMGSGTEPGSWSAVQSFTRFPVDIDALIEEAENRTGSSEQSANSLLAMHKGGEIIDLPIYGESYRLGSYHVIGAHHLVQHKDTDMLCIDGCNMADRYPWDAAHPEELPLRGGHNENYCSRATLAMIANLSGNQLSQDRISYHIFEEMGDMYLGGSVKGLWGVPDDDLGHGVGLYLEDAVKALDWIYGQPTGSAEFKSKNSTTFNEISEFLDDGRPLIRHETSHVNLIDGYAFLLKIDDPSVEVTFVRILEPSFIGWEAEMWQIHPFQENLIGYIFPPTVGAPIRSDEVELYLDSDHDGINDFDESERFGTDPNNPDTDMDGVRDKSDIVGYVFTRDGNFDPSDPDIDGDGAWKQVDPDNDWADDDGMMDGCEDSNSNGFYDPGWDETNCFVNGDDFDKFHSECQKGWVRNEYINDVHFPDMDLWLNWWEVISIEDEPLAFEGYIHKHVWQLIYDVDLNDLLFDVVEGGQGLARVKLEADPDGQYYLVIDVQPPLDIIEAITRMPSIGIYASAFMPQQFYFTGDLRHPIGEPVRNEQGALVLKGEFEPYLAFGIPVTPGCTQVFSWEVWIEPPPQ